MRSTAMFPYGWYLLGLLLLIAVILLEAWRQSRKMKRSGQKPEERGSLIGAGMFELQSLLQPDRKVEYMQMENRDKDRVNPAHRPGDSGDRDRAGS